MFLVDDKLVFPWVASRLIAVSLVSFLATTFTSSAIGQSPTPTPDRKKTFGHSLKRFESELNLGSSTARAIASDDIIRIETNMVVADVLVVNPKGNAIVGLSKDDFVITENGVRQETDLFSGGPERSIPCSIVLIIEVGTIPSMADKSLEAARRLVDKLGPHDRMAIVNTNTQLILDFTSDKKLLKKTLEALKAESWAGRHNYSSLIASLLELFSPQDVRPIVINQSYGDELGLLKPLSEANKRYCQKGVRGMCERKYSFAQLRDIVERSRATIYSVVPGPQFVGRSKDQQIKQALMYLTGYWDEIRLADHPLQRAKETSARDTYRKTWTENEIFAHVESQKSLIDISGTSGGVTQFLETPGDAEDIYDSIYKMIENRYTIGFYPKNETNDGKRRTIKIEVKGHPEYLILGRKTFFNPR
ncbi:MAG: VWA domain-containing protein [Pyrinomonadaceae bacterium]